jgi:hypothetical protein
MNHYHRGPPTRIALTRLVHDVIAEHPNADAESIAEAAMVFATPDADPSLSLALWLIASEALAKRAILSDGSVR